MDSWERMAVAGVRLWIAGDGPLLREVIAWAERRPEVEYLGVIAAEKKHEVLVAADGLLLPTRATDVSPLVIPEALGYGIPVLGSDGGSIPELIRPGVTGWLCDNFKSGCFFAVRCGNFPRPEAAPLHVGRLLRRRPGADLRELFALDNGLL